MKDQRERMVSNIRERYGLSSPRVLSVMLHIPRHKFVSKNNRFLAYNDAPVSIGFGQTMSQPYTVAFMTRLITEVLNSKHEIRNEYKISKSKIQKKVTKYGKVLEIGTGSGYQAAVLSKLFKEVYTIEIIPELAKKATKTLHELGYENVYVKKGSGEWGWPENFPFDAIMITAGVEKVPDELFEQLKPGGVLVAPVGKGNDKVMMRFTKLRNRGTKEQRNRKTKKSFGYAQDKLKNKGTKKLSNQGTEELKNRETKGHINKDTKKSFDFAQNKPKNRKTRILKEEKFGIFRFVPFINEAS